MADLLLEKGLPTNVDAERLLLGSTLLDNTNFEKIDLTEEDFSLEKHRIIFRRMKEMRELGEHIDQITLANELIRYGELQKVDGLTYLSSLDDGLPKLFNLLSYARIVKEKSALRQIIFRSQHLMNQCVVAEDSPATIISAAVHDLTKLNTFTTVLSSETPGQVVEHYPGGIDAFLRPERGIPTGFASLDDVIYGLQPEAVYVLGADASVGKSSLALNIASKVATAGHPVLYCSLEMSKAALVRRLVAAEAQVALHDIMRGLPDLIKLQALKLAHTKISDLPLYIDDDSHCSVYDFGKKIEQHIRQHKIVMAAIDYLQIMDWTGKGLPRFRDEREALTYATKQIKQYSKQFRIPIIQVSQLSRNRALRSSKDLRPKLRDLHGSSTIEKDADVVLLVYREEMDHPTRKELRGLAECLVAKNRNGRLSTIYMKFSGEFTQFEETAPPLGLEEE